MSSGWLGPDSPPPPAGGADSLAFPPGPARLPLPPGTRLPPSAQFCELPVSDAVSSRRAGSDPSRSMEPRQPPEAREPGPGAETAAVPRWEEAKTFYDNLSPKKKPKSVKAGLGFGGTREGPLPGKGSQALWEGTCGAPPEGDTASWPQNVPRSWLGLQFILGALL